MSIWNECYLPKCPIAIAILNVRQAIEGTELSESGW